MENAKKSLENMAPGALLSISEMSTNLGRGTTCWCNVQCQCVMTDAQESVV